MELSECQEILGRLLIDFQGHSMTVIQRLNECKVFQLFVSKALINKEIRCQEVPSVKAEEEVLPQSKSVMNIFIRLI